jgi:hypothetical protein
MADSTAGGALWQVRVEGGSTHTVVSWGVKGLFYRLSLSLCVVRCVCVCVCVCVCCAMCEKVD